MQYTTVCCGIVIVMAIVFLSGCATTVDQSMHKSVSGLNRMRHATINLEIVRDADENIAYLDVTVSRTPGYPELTWVQLNPIAYAVARTNSLTVDHEFYIQPPMVEENIVSPEHRVTQRDSLYSRYDGTGHSIVRILLDKRAIDMIDCGGVVYLDTAELERLETHVEVESHSVAFVRD